MFYSYKRVMSDLIRDTQETLPESIVKFRNAFEARPNIAEYIKQG